MIRISQVHFDSPREGGGGKKKRKKLPDVRKWRFLHLLDLLFNTADHSARPFEQLSTWLKYVLDGEKKTRNAMSWIINT